MRRAVLAVWVAIVAAVLWYGVRTAFAPLPKPQRESFSMLATTDVVHGADGRAYKFVAAPNITWIQARDAAARLSFHGKPGYLATVTSATELRFLVDHVFDRGYSDVTYLGGRQTAPREWRWVTGPEGLEDGGKGRLFWQGDEQGQPAAGQFADWQGTAFQHGNRWDARKVCCVTLYSYGLPRFSTSLGTGYWEEGVAGYLVEFGP